MNAAMKCGASGRSFPMPEGLDLSVGPQIVACPTCSRGVYVSRWNSVKRTMILTQHEAAPLALLGVVTHPSNPADPDHQAWLDDQTGRADDNEDQR